MKRKGYTRSIQTVLALLLFCLSLAAVSCRYLKREPTGETRTETRTVGLGDADSAAVLINLTAGELALGGGADGLLDATFQYNIDKWKPQVNYVVNGNQGTLTIEQPRDSIAVNETVLSDWRINLGNGVPIDLKVETAAGDGTLDLRGLDLTALDVRVGAGNADIDLSDSLDHDLHARIDTGFGNLSLKLPDDMGVQIDAQTGIGGLTSAGLTQDGDTYVNEAFGSAPHTLFLEIDSGIGSIVLSTP